MIKGLAKSKLNIIIDIILLILLVAMAGGGFLIKYILIPGSKRNIIYGADVDLQVLGLDRHQWGSIHLIISIAFVVLIIFHIIFHWDMVVAILSRMIPRKAVRSCLIAGLTIVSLVLFFGPFVVNPTQVPHENIYRNRPAHAEIDSITTEVQPNSLPPKVERAKELGISKSTHSATKEEFEVHGTQTLNEVSELYSVPADFICRELSISENAKFQRLGRLRKEHGFTMSEVSNAIAKYKNAKLSTVNE